jgi:transposase
MPNWAKGTVKTRNTIKKWKKETKEKGEEKLIPRRGKDEKI